MDSTTAKQFLISRVLDQAEVEHVPLSEVERKMLSFSEVHPSLPDIREINAEFERSYDSNEYEAKVAGLVKAARRRDGQRSVPQEQQWRDALHALKNEDHYILVMAAAAFGADAARGNNHQTPKYVIYVALAIGVALVLLVKLST